MNFAKADRVTEVVSAMKQTFIKQSPNRALLNSFFNGEAPWSTSEAKEAGIIVNFNNKFGTNIIHQARNQYENAFGKTGNFFKVSVPSAPAERQLAIGTAITSQINKALKNSRPFYYNNDNLWGGVVLHGVGAWTWWDTDTLLPSFTGIQDMLIPTNTNLAMDNVRYLAIHRELSPGALFRKTVAKGDQVDPGWQMKKVHELLDAYKDVNIQNDAYNWSDNPEKSVELYKQNTGGWDSDSAPKIPMWDFFYLEEESKNTAENGWYHKIILDPDAQGGKMQTTEPMSFVYDSKKVHAKTMDEFIHFQFGDGNNVPPFKFHSIRSLAWLIYDLVWIMNRLECQFTQHVFEQMMMLFRVQDPSDRDRLQSLVLQGIVGVLPDGLNMVPENERHQVQTNLVQGLLGNLRQRIGESSSQYTQQVDSGTQKERTAYEVQAVLAQASALMASMIGRAYRQQHYGYVEISRRAGNRVSSDFRVKKMHNAWHDEGIEDKWLDPERWEVEVEQVMGGGNRTLELAEATALYDRKNDFDPSSQQEIKHDYVLAVTNNPKKAERLATLNAAPKLTNGQDYAQTIFGSLMNGVDMQPREGLPHSEIIETLLHLMAQVIGAINKTDKMGTPQQVIGLQAVAAYITKHIQILAMDKKEKPRVKQYGDAMGQLMNEIKAFAERQAEAAQKQQQQPDPEAMSKIQSRMMETEAKLKAMEAKTQQGLRHKEAKFQQGVRQKAIQAATDVEIKTGQALADAHLAGLRNGPKNKNPLKE